MKALSLIGFVYVLLFSSCTEDNAMEGGNGNGQNINIQNSNNWLIPRKEVHDGGPGKDGIPALTEPELVSVDDITWLQDKDLVLAFADGENIRAYPHPILDWHEIINDKTENHSLAVIYCPLTGTGIGWNRIINGKETTFGVSGLLYNSNIIPYDRATNSNWSQLLLKSVNGSLSGQKAETYNLVESSWKTWKKMYPASKVVSRNTGYNRSYGSYPYGTYRENESLIFPVSNSDKRLHGKERVLTVFNGIHIKAYTFDMLVKKNNLIIDKIPGTEILVAGSQVDNLMIAFHTKTEDGTHMSFQIVENQLPVILTDDEGNNWDVFGRAVAGPRKGERLKTIPYMMGYWFSFAAFYPNIELYESE